MHWQMLLPHVVVVDGKTTEADVTICHMSKMAITPLKKYRGDNICLCGFTIYHNIW